MGTAATYQRSVLTRGYIMYGFTSDQSGAITSWLAHNPNLWTYGVWIDPGRPWMDELPVVRITALRDIVPPDGVQFSDWEEDGRGRFRRRAATWQPSPLFKVKAVQTADIREQAA